MWETSSQFFIRPGTAQGRSQDFHSEGDTPPFPLPLPPPSFPPALSFPFPFLPLLPFHLLFPIRSPMIQLGGLEERCKLPQRVQEPDRQTIFGEFRA